MGSNATGPPWVVSMPCWIHLDRSPGFSVVSDSGEVVHGAGQPINARDLRKIGVTSRHRHTCKNDPELL